MSAGFRVNNADGSLAFDMGRRLFRKLALVNYGNSNGAANFARQPQDTVLVPVVLGWYAPTFYIDVGSSTISWDHGLIPAAQRRGGTVEIWAY